MAQEKESWDDIPSLEGLAMDWEYQPDNGLGNRSHRRLLRSQLLNLLEVSDLPVKLAAGQNTSRGVLRDLSVGGLALDTKLKLEKNQAFRVGFFLGKEKVIASAMVKEVDSSGGGFEVHAGFIDLDKRTAKIIDDLYPALVLKQSF